MGTQPVPPRGTFAQSSRNVARVAMGRRPASGMLLMPGETPAADSEIVWSWRRDPGVTSAGVSPPATGARKAASPGRSRISRKPIARGKPVSFGRTRGDCLSFAFFIASEAAGAAGARLSLRPSRFRGTTKMQNPDKRVAGTKMHVLPEIQMSSRRTPGPITTGPCFCEGCGFSAFQQRHPVAMGPGVRRDDSGVGGAIAPAYRNASPVASSSSPIACAALVTLIVVMPISRAGLRLTPRSSR